MERKSTIKRKLSVTYPGQTSKWHDHNIIIYELWVLNMLKSRNYIGFSKEHSINFTSVLQMLFSSQWKTHFSVTSMIYFTRDELGKTTRKPKQTVKRN